MVSSPYWRAGTVHIGLTVSANAYDYDYSTTYYSITVHHKSKNIGKQLARDNDRTYCILILHLNISTEDDGQRTLVLR
jgi:hypothetical protein